MRFRVSLVRVSRVLDRRPIPPSMGRVLHAFRSRKLRIAVNATLVAGALTAAGLATRHFLHSGWPLSDADPLLVAAAGVLFVAAYAFKAWGWQRLVAPGGRPQALTLAAPGGAPAGGGGGRPGPVSPG